MSEEPDHIYTPSSHTTKKRRNVGKPKSTLDDNNVSIYSAKSSQSTKPSNHEISEKLRLTQELVSPNSEFKIYVADFMSQICDLI
jgi:hypothetical protein